MIEYVHEECGQAAFYYERMPRPGERVMVARAMLLDGTRPKFGDPIVCGSCHRPLQPGPLRLSNCRHLTTH